MMTTGGYFRSPPRVCGLLGCPSLTGKTPGSVWTLKSATAVFPPLPPRHRRLRESPLSARFPGPTSAHRGRDRCREPHWSPAEALRTPATGYFAVDFGFCEMAWRPSTARRRKMATPGSPSRDARTGRHPRGCRGVPAGETFSSPPERLSPRPVWFSCRVCHVDENLHVTNTL